MSPTPRAERRIETIRRITAAARERLAESGPEDLSLREIARELGLASSGIYRYVESKDALITALIVEAYGALADTLETIDPPTPRNVALGLLHWAKDQPHLFALLYGTPIRGYRAPQDTIVQAARVFGCFAAATTRREDETRPENETTTASRQDENDPVPPELRERLDLVAAEVPGLTGDIALATTRLFALTIGVTTMELGGHLVGTLESGEALLAHLADAH